MKKSPRNLLMAIIISSGCFQIPLQAQLIPEQLQFVRQGVRRLIFDADQSIPLASLDPATVVGFSSMYPINHYSSEQAALVIQGDQLRMRSERESQTGIWFGGFNPFATYHIDLTSCSGQGEIGFEFCSPDREIFIYTYPDLKEAGTMRMDLPPWNENSGTRVWPNVVQLPEGYPVRYVALMMDRFNFPGMIGPHWSYGALYLYHAQ